MKTTFTMDASPDAWKRCAVCPALATHYGLSTWGPFVLLVCKKHRDEVHGPKPAHLDAEDGET